jgi:hypothetical protein
MRLDSSSAKGAGLVEDGIDIFNTGELPNLFALHCRVLALFRVLGRFCVLLSAGELRPTRVPKAKVDVTMKGRPVGIVVVLVVTGVAVAPVSMMLAVYGCSAGCGYRSSAGCSDRGDRIGDDRGER